MKNLLFLTLCLLISGITNAQKVFTVEYASQADVKVFVADYSSRAGWKKNEKMHLFY